MISAVSNFHDRVWTSIEDRCMPGPKGWNVVHVLPLLIEIPTGLILGLVQVINKILALPFNFAALPDPRKDFSSVLKDARQWKKLIDSEITLGRSNTPFLKGISTCTYQDSGSFHCPNSHWAKWEEKVLPEENRSGKSANIFELYKTKEGRDLLIDRLLEMGLDAYRFSIEWSHIEPQEGQWNEADLQIYLNLCKHLRDRGITPMITLHHFSEPHWFHEKGSFENEANIEAFISFALKVVPTLTQIYKGKPLVEYFCTINEPNVEAFSRFIRGAFSPGLTMNFTRAAHFLKGAFKAHSLVYERLKKIIPTSVQIGIVHQYLRFIPTNPLLYPLTFYLNRIMNEASFTYFSTGKFEFKIPFVRISDEKMPTPKTDFVGLQYYVRPRLGLLGSTSDYGQMTQMPFCEDPEGLYEAIIETHKAYKVPVIVTENGISTHDNDQRARYLSRALYAAQRAQEVIGESNLLGYFQWSLSDNFEWDMGMKPQAFGAYTVDGKLKVGSKITQVI
ncbi:MAG: glycoside hydrolase family 1 protein [Verrucomicrobia bacterium]|nr:glycoside hydrolase family 1 protein [Verrucomicrobiota bacterium]